MYMYIHVHVYMQYLPLLANSILFMALPDSLNDLSTLQDLASTISTYMYNSYVYM